MLLIQMFRPLWNDKGIYLIKQNFFYLIEMHSSKAYIYHCKLDISIFSKVNKLFFLMIN